MTDGVQTVSSTTPRSQGSGGRIIAEQLPAEMSPQIRSSYHCDGKESAHGATLFLPILNEADWPTFVRIVLYLIGLLNTFVGISFAVDIFMNAAEKITSKMITIKDPFAAAGQPKYKTVRLWNQTVATLTLGAVATASPEILLNVAETIGHNFNAGSLGPGTIIGSAAFNLMATTALAIISVPTPATRRIEQPDVYVVTNLFSIFSYMWIIFVLDGTSHGQIEVWEAIATIAFYAVFVLTAYAADKQMFRKLVPKCCKRIWSAKQRTKVMNLTSASQNGAASAQNGVSRVGTANGFQRAVTPAGFGRESQNGLTPPSPVHSTYSASNGQTTYRGKLEDTQHSLAFYRRRKYSINPAALSSIVSFGTKKFALSQEDRTLGLKVLRSGDTTKLCQVRFETVDGTAQANTDFLPNSGKVIFEPGVTEKVIEVQVVVKDLARDSDKVFYVKLVSPKHLRQKLRLGSFHLAEVCICAGHAEARVSFKDKRHLSKETAGTVKLKLERSGKVSIKSAVTVLTKDGSASAGKNYVALAQTVHFESGETEKVVEVELINTGELSKNITFDCLLDNPDGARIAEPKTMTIIITTDDEVANKLAEASKLVHEMLHEKRSWSQAWRNQFTRALSANNGDIMSATSFDYFLHAISFYWKILFACVPPVQILDGYVTYLVSLFIIGALISIVGDVAQIFGCLCGLNDVVVAALFISVGTNLPDMLASRFAAIQESFADNAIGHIQGSICVNVFLGLGLPWLFSACYKQAHGEIFRVDTDELWWSVSIYLVLSIISTFILVARGLLKCCGKAVLGGPLITKLLSGAFMFLMWLTYVVLTGLKSTNIIKVSTGFSGSNAASSNH